MFGYLFVFSGTGIVERKKLEAMELELDLEIEKLQTENKRLEEKEKLLRDDSYALEKEARKYYFLSEDAHVIKFQEPKSSGKSCNGCLNPKE